jgi:hypothetical protein
MYLLETKNPNSLVYTIPWQMFENSGSKEWASHHLYSSAREQAMRHKPARSPHPLLISMTILALFRFLKVSSMEDGLKY